YSPETVFYLSILNSVICLFLRLMLLDKLIGLSILSFIRNVLSPLILVTALAYICPVIIVRNFESTFFRLIIAGGIGLFTSICSVYFLGISKGEKDFLTKTLKGIRR